MKTVFISILFVLLASKGSGQFVIDAGNDAKMCHPYDTIILGGHPAASGGIEPYKYEWSLRFHHAYPWHVPVSSLLDHPDSPNPRIIGVGCNYNDTIEFYLSVTDAGNNVLTDSAGVAISSILCNLCIDNCGYLDIGDSVQLSPRNLPDGIPPFTYLWKPITGLSDPYIEKPWAKPDISTYYSVKVTDAIGCDGYDGWSVGVRTTGIDPDHINKGSFVRPNPINYYSIIHLNNTDLTYLTIKVFNQNGELVLSGKYYQDYRIGEKISTPGTYFYRILEGNKPVSGGKIIKL